MSVNWVMISSTDDFVRLPNEQKLYTSPSRVSIALASQNKYPGRQPYSLASSSGKVFLTSRRIIYLPTTPPPCTSNQPPPTQLASFAAPLSHLHDSHVTTPWLGPNTWIALVQPVPGGGIPGHHAVVELRLTFKDGGAYDFHERFCHIRERLAQLRDIGSDGGGGGGRAAQHYANNDVNFEQLPAYEPRAEGGGLQPPQQQQQRQPQPLPQQQAAGDLLVEIDDANSVSVAATGGQVQPPPTLSSSTPAEPPPGYEEVQRDSVAELLESNLSVRGS